MEIEYCKHCDRTLPLTEEFWNRCGKGSKNFDIWKCRDCRIKYSRKRYLAVKEHGEATVREVEARLERFDPFCKAALQDRIRRLEVSDKPAISIYAEI